MRGSVDISFYIFSGIKRSMMAKQNSLDDVGLELDGDDQVRILSLRIHDTIR
jgi:hypothetical protein